jgi:hypothetical protein
MQRFTIISELNSPLILELTQLSNQGLIKDLSVIPFDEDSSTLREWEECTVSYSSMTDYTFGRGSVLFTLSSTDIPSETIELFIRVIGVTEYHIDQQGNMSFYTSNHRPYYISPTKSAELLSKLSVCQGMKYLSSNPLSKAIIPEAVKYQNFYMVNATLSVDYNKMEEEINNLESNGYFRCDGQRWDIIQSIAKAYGYELKDDVIRSTSTVFDKNFFLNAYSTIVTTGQIPVITTTLPLTRISFSTPIIEEVILTKTIDDSSSDDSSSDNSSSSDGSTSSEDEVLPPPMVNEIEAEVLLANFIYNYVTLLECGNLPYNTLQTLSDVAYDVTSKTISFRCHNLTFYNLLATAEDNAISTLPGNVYTRYQLSKLGIPSFMVTEDIIGYPKTLDIDDLIVGANPVELELDLMKSISKRVVDLSADDLSGYYTIGPLLGIVDGPNLPRVVVSHNLPRVVVSHNLPRVVVMADSSDTYNIYTDSGKVQPLPKKVSSSIAETWVSLWSLVSGMPVEYIIPESF